MIRLAPILGTFAVLAPPAAAEPGGDTTVDAGAAVAFPTALPTGLASGIGAGWTRGAGALRWGARAAWVTATESGMTWAVTHADLRLRATGSLEHVAGRGRFGLRLGLGGTLVHESRLRHQGERAGLSGEALRTSAWVMVPAADVDAVVALQLAGPWLLVMSAGPSMAVVDGELRASWSGQLGIGWQP